MESVCELIKVTFNMLHTHSLRFGQGWITLWLELRCRPCST